MLAKSGNLKKKVNSIIHDRVDLYSSMCMSDPNFMALALTGTEKTGLNAKPDIKCEVSEQ